MIYNVSSKILQNTLAKYANLIKYLKELIFSKVAV